MSTLYIMNIVDGVVRNSADFIWTCYELDGPGIESL